MRGIGNGTGVGMVIGEGLKEKIPDWAVNALCDGGLGSCKTPRSDGGRRVRVAVQESGGPGVRSGRKKRGQRRGARGAGWTVRRQGHCMWRASSCLELRWNSGFWSDRGLCHDQKRGHDAMAMGGSGQRMGCRHRELF